MTLSMRLALAMVTLVAGTTIAILFLVNKALESIIGARALLQIETDARLIAAKLGDQIDNLRSDVTLPIPSVALDQIVRSQAASSNRSDPGVAEAAYQRLAAFLSGHLAGRPSYLQFSIIGVDDGGREIMRIERARANDPLRLVPDIELQRRGDTDYYLRTKALRAGEIHVAPIELIRTTNAGAGSAAVIPALRATTPIIAADGSFLGIIATVAEMRLPFDTIGLQERLSGTHIDSSRRIYLIDRRGKSLSHAVSGGEPEAASNVAPRITTEFSGLSHLIGTARPSALIVTDMHGAKFGAAVVPVQPAETFWMGVVALVPHTEIMAPIFAFRRAAIVAGGGALIFAVILAVLFASSITKPLVQMTKAVDSFAPGANFRMPESSMRSTDEIGILAKSFDRIVSQLSHEIKQRERLLDELRDVYARQNAVFANAAEGILIVDPHGNIESLNPAAERMFGVTARSASGLSINTLLELPVSPDAVLSADLSAGTPAASTSHEVTARRCDRTTFPADVLLTRAVIGNRQMSLLFVRDVTARNVADERFRMAVEASPSGMVMMNRYGTILLVNAETEKLFQYRREELVGQRVDVLIPEHSRVVHSDDRKAFLDNPEAPSMRKKRELHGLRKDGTEFPIEVGFNPIRMRDGSTVILSAVNDVSERKRTEQMKDEFVAMVSHELRTPLTSITASLALLAADPTQTLPEPAKRLLTIAHNNSQRLVRLINDILDLEKMESGKIEFNMRTVEIRPLIEQAIEANRGFADQFNVHIRLDPQSEDFTAVVDTDRLIQVMTNLLSNAVKYSPSGGEVLVTTRAFGNAGRIAVRDYGPGIPEKFKPRIFERFAQADSREAREKGGTGLGLSIVKQIMVRLGGSASFESAPGQGTIFYVDLPLAELAQGSSNRAAQIVQGQIREVA